MAGTGTQRKEACLEVGPNSRTGRLLGLSKPTYFYRGGVAFVRENVVKNSGCKCLPSELFRVEEIIGERSPPKSPSGQTKP